MTYNFDTERPDRDPLRVEKFYYGPGNINNALRVTAFDTIRVSQVIITAARADGVR